MPEWYIPVKSYHYAAHMFGHIIQLDFSGNIKIDVIVLHFDILIGHRSVEGHMLFWFSL